MIQLIIQSYLPIFLSIAAICAIVFFFGLVLIFKVNFKNKPPRETITIKKTASIDVNQSSRELADLKHDVDLTLIAGDDIMTTQLDLARALMETGDKQSARIILQQVAKQGSDIQKQEAQSLLSVIYT